MNFFGKKDRRGKYGGWGKVSVVMLFISLKNKKVGACRRKGDREQWKMEEQKMEIRCGAVVCE